VSVTIRRAERADFPALFQLIVALADFEKLDPPDAAAQARLQRDGWPADGAHARFEVWLAEVTEKGTTRAVGYAITFETYSSFLARPTLYLEDLFLLPSHRRLGIGKTMLQTLVADATRRGCGRVEWVVLDWNTEAQKFYDRFGAKHLTEWQTYRVVLPTEPAADMPDEA
jgi:GNAT superfamily N-acetyltransferase